MDICYDPVDFKVVVPGELKLSIYLRSGSASNLAYISKWHAWANPTWVSEWKGFKRTSQRFQRSVTDCGSRMSKSSAASMSSKYMGGLKSGRSSRFVMVFFLIGELDRDRLPRLAGWESGSDLAVFWEDIVRRSNGMPPKSPNFSSGSWESRASSADSGTGSVTRFSTVDEDNKRC